MHRYLTFFRKNTYYFCARALHMRSKNVTIDNDIMCNKSNNNLFVHCIYQLQGFMHVIKTGTLDRQG